MASCSRCGKRISIWDGDSFSLFCASACRACEVATRVAENALVPPPSVFPAPPRSVRWRRFPFWVGIIFLLFPAFFFIAFGCLTVPIVLTATGKWLGTTVPGEISDKTMQKGHFRRPRQNRHQYCLDFAYRVNETNVVSRMCVDRQSFDRVEVGDRVQVRVLRVAPGLSAVIAEPDLSESSDRLFFAALAFCPCLILSLVYGFVSMTVVRRRHLVRCGNPTAGWISAKKITRGKKGMRYYLTYQYAAPQNPLAQPVVSIKHTGPAIYVSKVDYEATKIGENVTVLVDPRHPYRSVVYRYAEFEIVGLN